MDDNKVKHLEMIQAVINRMAQNSFLLKGWSVVLTAAIFALAADFRPKNLEVNETAPSGRQTAYIFTEEMCNALWMAYANGVALCWCGATPAPVKARWPMPLPPI